MADSGTTPTARKPQTAYTPCAYEGCDLSPAKDHIALFRVNPKGEVGIFMCAEHKRIVDEPPREPGRRRDAETECLTCGEIADELPIDRCPEAKRPCGHHCNHVWTSDTCCWCGIEYGEPDV